MSEQVDVESGILWGQREKIGSLEWGHGIFLVFRWAFEHMMDHYCHRSKGARFVSSSPRDGNHTRLTGREYVS